MIRHPQPNISTILMELQMLTSLSLDINKKQDVEPFYCILLLLYILLYHNSKNLITSISFIAGDIGRASSAMFFVYYFKPSISNAAVLIRSK